VDIRGETENRDSRDANKLAVEFRKGIHVDLLVTMARAIPLPSGCSTVREIDFFPLIQEMFVPDSVKRRHIYMCAKEGRVEIGNLLR
jgi:hypothetical protein